MSDGNENVVHSNFEQQALDREDKTLKYYTDKANSNQDSDVQHQYILNLSLSEIAANISVTFIAVINDLVNPSTRKDLNGLLNIFFKENRMIYIGLTILLISFGLYVIDITS